MDSRLLLFISLILLAVSIYLQWEIRFKKTNQTETPQHKIPQVISSLSYNNIIEIVDKMINFEVSNTILKNGLRNKSEEELSIVLDDHILSIMETVYTSISDDLMTAFQYYVTDNYIRNYIKDTTRLILVANLMTVK